MIEQQINYVNSFPYEIKVIEHVNIPMSDGINLSAKLWLPENAEDKPVPAILEYIPYRKRDLTRVRDSMNYKYFAGHGYAGVRVDIRGTGESEGVLKDEYLQQELDDGLEILQWIAAQPWCNGNIGMIGISWGGFNGLQIASLQPNELKAVITLCSTDDRYADDVHYMGGCLLGDNLSWASTMFARNAKPPDPHIAGDKWRDMWLERLNGSGLWLKQWLEHQNRDDYWKHGSICEDFSSIKIPVLAASGWADGYSNAVFRLLANLKVPRKGLIGPWSHKYPHFGKPGPAIGFLREALRWWDKWLKGIENGIMNEPMLRVWMQDYVPPTASYSYRPGKWIAENEWPSKNVKYKKYHFGLHRILKPGKKAVERKLPIQSPLSVGLFAGKWCSYSATPDLPHDQREEDGGALIFDSEPLQEDIHLLGAPKLKVEFSSDKPVAMMAVRLSDIAPDDKATRVTYGILNLTHRNSHEYPEYLEPDKRYQVEIQLNDIAQVFPKGHRFRISISTSYFPLAWTPPEPVRLQVYTANTTLQLPVRHSTDQDSNLRKFGAPETAQPVAKTLLEPKRSNWFVKRDLANDISTLEVLKDDGKYILNDINLQIGSKTMEWYSYMNDNFDTVRGETYWEQTFERKNWQVRTVTRTILTSDKDNFRIQADLDAYENETRIFSKSWDEKIKRKFV